jgi:hypothetical protein
MDTLIPAVEALEKALAEDKNFSEVLKDMKIAAEAGKESTFQIAF